MALPLPDALTALLFAGAALLDFVPVEKVPPALLAMAGELTFVLFVEAGFLLAQGTLVDIATRLRKRPPIWVAALILIAVVLFSDHTWGVIQMAWQRGSLVFVPFLISIAERGTMLWRMPDRPQIEKIAARALIANRIITGLGLFGLLTITMLIGVAFELYLFENHGGKITMLAGAIYFGIAAFDDWRVRGPKFAKKPRVLFRYDAMGIDYLEPV